MHQLEKKKEESSSAPFEFNGKFYYFAMRFIAFLRLVKLGNSILSAVHDLLFLSLNPMPTLP